MGEIANSILEDMFTLDYEDEMEDPDWNYHIVRSRSIQCRYCKRKGFHWEEDDEGRWRLSTPTDRPHRCSAYWKALEKEIIR